MPKAMTPEAFFEMLRYVRWSPEDERALAELQPHVEPHLGAITDEFYERIREHPGANAVLRDEAQVRRLQGTLQQWVRQLLTGPYDEGYYEQRRRIGAVHARIGLPQRYVCGAMSLIRSHLQRIALDTYGPTAPGAHAARVALEKILDLELAIMLETYRAAMLERLHRAEAGEREGMAQKLAAAEERYRSAVESSPALVLVLDSRERPLVWNLAASRLTGYELDELPSPSPLELLPDPAARERIRRASPASPDTFESPLVTRSGRQLLLRWSVAAVAEPALGGDLRHVLGIDVTEVREAERRARSSERLAAVGTMAAGLAHEIRNPLNAASLHVTLLERSLRRLPDADPAREATVVLRNELQRLSSLLNEFLSFARPRPLRPWTQGLAALLRSVVELLQPDADSASSSLRLEVPSREVWADVDDERLRQVLINLVRNALEAGARTVTLRVRRVAAFAEIDVEDDGQGIPEGTPIFDAFFTTKEQGTGLGLSIVHRIVDDHGGTITCRSQPGQTLFTVRLEASSPPAGAEAERV